jgi:hypothetical protein
MRSRVTGLVAAAVLMAALSAPAETRMVERVLAVADGRPVLLSEVRAAARVRGEETGPALESVIDEMLMFAAASRLPQAAVGAEEEERALKVLVDVAARAGGDAPDIEALRRMARRQAVILKYVDFRFRPQVRVTEEDVRAALRTGGGEGAPATAGEVEASRGVLEAEDLDRRIEGWVADLRREARIRYNPLSGTAPATR